MMGCEEVLDRPATCLNQNVPFHVSDWLQSNTRPYYNSVKDHQWPPAEYKVKGDVDQQSITSVDDNVSLSDSNHESCSSDSSTHTYYTNATDPTDFLSEEERENNQSKTWYKGPPPTHFRDETFEEEHYRKLNELLVADYRAGLCQPPASKGSSIGVQRESSPVARSVRSRPLDRSQNSSECQRQSVHEVPSAELRTQKCNTRRTSCSSKNQLPPCKLTRDTECTDQFVTLLIIFATRLITAIWPLSASPPMMSSCFNGAGVLPLRVFIQETLKRSRASYSTLQVALYYLILLKARLPTGYFAQEQNSAVSHGECPEKRTCRAMQCGRRMFLSALMLASKYLQDRNYSARAWSKISGLRSSEINENEREYLSLIDYSLHVPKDSFDNWSKIVISLSKLSKKAPQCRLGQLDSDFSPRGGGIGKSLAEMVPSLHLDENEDHGLFSDEWWTDIVRRLDPRVVKDTILTESFLSTHVPGYRGLSCDIYKPSNTGYESTAELDSPPPAMDINLCDTLKSRKSEPPQYPTPQTTPQTPVQMSPVRLSEMPMQPQLRNLPTPQTTPRISDGCQPSTPCSRPSLRCSASVDALRSMRRQCIVNANLDRCPPPRPQAHGLPPTRSLMRPAETIQELPSRSTTPSMSSPASVASDATSCTSVSRSSSMSSSSSWSACSSTMPQIRGATRGRFSSPLAWVPSMSSRYYNSGSADKARDASVARFHDEGYGSGEEPTAKFPRGTLPSGCDAAAVRILLSLASQSETTSQSTTPTLQNFTAPSKEAISQLPRGHKRTLSKTDGVQDYVRNLLLRDTMSGDIVQDELASYNVTPKQLQEGTRRWAAPRMAIPNKIDSKRMALHCARQHSSAPDLAAQYLRQQLSMTAS